MSILRCALLLSALSCQLLAFTAVAQQACRFSPIKDGICIPYKDCKVLHGQFIFSNSVCKGNTICCPIDLATIINNPPLSPDRLSKIFNFDVEGTKPPVLDNTVYSKSELEAQANDYINDPWHEDKPVNNPSTDFQKFSVNPINPVIPCGTDNLINPRINSLEIQAMEEDAYWNPCVNDPVVVTPPPVQKSEALVNPNRNEPRPEDKPMRHLPEIARPVINVQSGAVAQHTCRYSSTKDGICRPYKDCKELHGQLIFLNAACKENTICCPNDFKTTPLSNSINNHEPEANMYTRNPPLSDDKLSTIFNSDVGGTKPPVFDNTGYSNSGPEAQDFDVGGTRPPAFDNTGYSNSVPKPEANPNIIGSWHRDTLENSSKDFSEIQANPINPIINAPWGAGNPIEPIDSAEAEVMEENGYFDSLGNDAIDIPPPIHMTIGSILTTPNPITTTTEFIPFFDEEFYRRLGLAFGKKYDRRVVATTENNSEADVVSVIVEEVTTNSTNFMNNLNKLGLQKLSSQKCGFINVNNDTLKSNVEAGLLEFPWLALLRYKDDAESIKFSCGGSLITERWVLTAARCISKTLFGVRLAEYEQESKKDCVHRICTSHKDFKIVNMVKHPDYKPETGYKDIALIKLSPKAQISNNIRPICLPTKVDYFNVPYDNMPLTISGWGLNKAGATKIMKKHTIKRSKPQVCQQANPAELVQQSKLCLATHHEQSCTCSGDPGGPVSWIVNYGKQLVIQIGVVPFGMDECGAADGVVSSYYVESVADSMDWITKIIGED